MTTYLSPVAGGADNTSQINAAILLVTSGNGSSVVLEQGLFVVDGVITINRPVSFRGSGDGVTTLAFGASGGIVVAPAPPAAPGDVLSFISLANFDIISKNRTKRAAAAIKTTNLYNSTISGITIRDHLIGIELNSATVVTVENVSVLEMTVQSTGILVKGGRDHFLTDIYIDQSQSSSGNAGGSVGIDVPWSAATWMSNIDVINFDYGVRFHPCRAGQPANQAVDWCFLSQVAVDQCKIAGFYFNVGVTGGNNAAARLLGVSLVNCWAGSNKVGVLIEKADSRAKMDGIDLVGMKIIKSQDQGIVIGASYSASTSDERIRNIKISDCKVAGNSDTGLGTKPGILVGSGTKNLQILDCSIGTWGQFFVTQSNAIHLQTSPVDGTAGIIISGNMLEGSTGAAILDQALSVAKVIHGNSGFVTEFAGKTFVPNGLTEVVVNHFCNGIPVWVSVTPIDNMSNYDPPVVTAITATTFKIVLSNTAFGNKFFMFKAQVYP